MLNERPYRPGVHGRDRHVLTEYARRLQEKQRLRAQYYISERQLRTAFAAAAKQSGRTGDNLIADLERRLDTVVLRSGFATSIYEARQLVSHRHVLVNGERINVPAYRVQDGDYVSIKAKSHGMPVFVAAREGALLDSPPPYLEVSRETLTTRMLRSALREESPVICDVQLVVEYYAR